MNPDINPGATIRVIPDLTAIVSGNFFLWITQRLEQSDLDRLEVLLLRPLLEEIEYQASLGHSVGFVGLNELKKLRALEDSLPPSERPQPLALHIVEPHRPLDASGNEASTVLDRLIRYTAHEQDAILFTVDPIQAELAAFEQLPHIELTSKPLSAAFHTLEDFFSEGVMSIHLNENCPPRVKRGHPGAWRLEPVADALLSRSDLEFLITDLIGRSKSEPDKTIEIERRGATVLQFADMRVVIAQPPFSKEIEITATRPVVQLSLDDYSLSQKLRSRLRKQAEGILIAGPPGSGKTSFAAALAEFFAGLDRIVKTMEQPRDLRVPSLISQYAALEGDMALTADVLLLVRPDACIFDEMRKTSDFKVYADMRLAGVGMVGICHATRPIDAIQRFLGRVELGMIPQVVDTVIFIHAGQVETVLDIAMTVKVPTGLASADLARPVLEVRNFDTGALMFEIFSFGEQITTIPIKEHLAGAEAAFEKKERQLVRALEQFVDTSRLRVEMIGPKRARIYVPSSVTRRVIGKGGKTIRKLEKRTGLKLDVEKLTPTMEADQLLEQFPPYSGFPIEAKLTDRHIILDLGPEEEGRQVHILNADQQSLMVVTVGRGGEIKIRLDSDLGQTLVAELAEHGSLFAFDESDSW